MSFYGSIYYQAGEALTKVFIQNFGKNKTDFLEENLEDEVEIKADGRKGSFYLNNGNRWLSLKGDAENNLCTIYHNAPDETNLSQYLVPITKIDEIPTGATPVELPLNDDIYFSTPAIYYDEAGHVIPTGNLMYFKIPKIEIQSSIDSLSQSVDKLDIAVTDHEKRISTNTRDIANAASSITSLEGITGTNSTALSSSKKTLIDVIGNYDDMLTEVQQSAMAPASEGVKQTVGGFIGRLYTLYNSYNKELKTLIQDIREIENRLSAGGL